MSALRKHRNPYPHIDVIDTETWQPITWSEHVLRDISRQAAEHYKTLPAGNPQLEGKRLWSPRDSYGWRSL